MDMTMRMIVPILLLASASACSRAMIDAPSLEPRAGEQLDPRLPVVEENVAPVPVNSDLRGRLDTLLAQAEDGARVFDILAAGIVPEIEAAGEPGSESWTAATEQLSRLDTARAPVSNALADADALATKAIADDGWVNPSEREAIVDVAARIAAVDARLAMQIDRLTGLLRP